MTSTLREEEHKSDCCAAPVKVVGGDEGTNHWECEKCGKSCNDTFYVGHSKREEKVCGNCKKPFRGATLCPHVAPSPEEGWEAFKSFIQPFKNRAYTQETADEIERRVSQLLSKERERLEEEIGGRCWKHEKQATEAERARVVEIMEGISYAGIDGEDAKNLIVAKITQQ